MIITLYGKNSYRRIKNLKEIINPYLEKYSAYYRFDFSEEEDIEGLKSILSTSSMFSNKKLVVIDHPFMNRPKKDLKNILKERSETKDIVIVLNTNKKIPAGFPFLKKEPNIYKEQKEPKGDELKSFIINESKVLGLDIKTKDIDKLIETYKNDLWSIVKKLEQASLRDKVEIDTSNLGENFDYFSNLNNLGKGFSTEKRMTALENLLVGRRDEAARVFNGLAFRPSNEKEADMYASYDIAIKSGKLDYEEILLAIALGLNLE